MEEINCKKCSNLVQEAKYVAAGGLKYHISCFTCVNCSSELAQEEFFERDVQKNEYYCINCYFSLYGKICDYCQEVIKDNFIQALDKWFHPEHFVCEGCKAPVKGNCFYKYNDKPYCKEDFLRVNNAICAGCGKYILDRIYSALNKSWHGFCFKCQHCQKAFTDFKFVEHEKLPYHEQCYSLLFGIKCHACNNKIVGSYLQANEQPLHEQCFICKLCQKSLEKETWIEQNSFYYCQSCFLNTIALKESKKDNRKMSQLQSQSQEKENSQQLSDQQTFKYQTQSQQIKVQESEQTSSQQNESKHTDEFSDLQNELQQDSKQEILDRSESAEIEREYNQIDKQSNYAQHDKMQLSQLQQQIKMEENIPAQTQSSNINKTSYNHQNQIQAKQQTSTQQKDKQTESKTEQISKENIRRSSAANNSVQNITKQATTQEKNEERKQETAAKASDSGSKTYSFEQLLGSNLPPEVDPANKELWLHDEIFKTKFSCDKESYQKLPTWKKVMLRKKANLF